MSKGIDCALPLSSSVAQKLADEGIKFVCRYLVPERLAWKRLTRAEAEAISAAGMHIVSVFETSADRARGGAAAGAVDGAEAYAEAQMIGQPKGTAIYFAVDFDAQPADYDAIESYLRAAGSRIDGYYVGCYGSYAVIEEMTRRDACTHFWQTYAWSRGKFSDYANIYQYKNGVQIAGITVDLNESYGGEGWWNVVEKKTHFVDVPAGHWAEDSIAAVSQEGIEWMTGVGDGKFEPDRPITRAEMAVLANRILYYINSR